MLGENYTKNRNFDHNNKLTIHQIQKILMALRQNCANSIQIQKEMHLYITVWRVRQNLFDDPNQKLSKMIKNHPWRIKRHGWKLLENAWSGLKNEIGSSLAFTGMAQEQKKEWVEILRIVQLWSGLHFVTQRLKHKM